jgi:hypothetical protein
MYVCMYVCRPVCPSVCLSVCLSVCPSLCLSASLRLALYVFADLHLCLSARKHWPIYTEILSYLRRYEVFKVYILCVTRRLYYIIHALKYIYLNLLTRISYTKVYILQTRPIYIGYTKVYILLHSAHYNIIHDHLYRCTVTQLGKYSNLHEA